MFNSLDLVNDVPEKYHLCGHLGGRGLSKVKGKFIYILVTLLSFFAVIPSTYTPGMFEYRFLGAPFREVERISHRLVTHRSCRANQFPQFKI